ncbi:glycoside hydrolase family 5 protein [soil metagenome]
MVKRSAIATVLLMLITTASARAGAPTSRPFDAAFQFGVNLSSLQGTPDHLPGRLNGEVFITPESHFAYYESKGMTHIRLEGSWERLQPRLEGFLGEQLLDHYADANNPLRNPVNLVRYYLDLAQRHHLKVILDLAHNYGSRRIGYDGTWKSQTSAQLGSAEVPVSAFVDYNVKLVKAFGRHPAVIGIELMNEPHDLAIGTEGWVDACQKSIDAIRAENRSIAIVIDGYGWSNAEYWANRNPTLHTLRDPSDRLIFSAHQYFDDSSEGVYHGSEAKNPTHDKLDIGARRIQPFIDWVAKHHFQGHASLGEFGAPNTQRWSEVVRQMILSATAADLMLTAHEDVPYKNSPYVMSLFPPDGEGDRTVIRLMQSAKDGTGFMQKPIAP